MPAPAIYLVRTDLDYVRIYTALPKRLKGSKAFAKAFQAHVFCPQAAKDLRLLRFPKHVPIRVSFAVSR